ncbi:MAG: nucleotidyl transferase AbiEii/AbiGii toxin family protein [Clostridia bacterium]|nr:nucleotidyl transferase AbiEii/AbiGii toxin family protein [Clostridia bacterium]
MNITAEEKIMYKVMKAIYDSGIPISFKGSMVLKACLLEAGYDDDTRHTVDIDANWNSDTPPTSEQMVESLQKAIDKSGVDLEVKIYRMYGEKRSAGFELIDRETEEILFTMDVDVNRPVPPTKIYEVEGLRFCGVSPSQMIADKVAAISTEKVFRRIKDVVDLYYISKVFEFNTTDVLQTLKNSERALEDFNGFLHRPEDLQHSYEKFRFAGGVNKPDFEDVYRSVKAYIKGVLPKEKKRDLER